MNPHRPKKPAIDEYTTDEEEMIVYDVEDEIETNPDYVKENDVDPSDTDYVTGLASEEDESLLEADFKQVADNPLKGPLSPSSLKK
ncbi:hypothetical protein TNCV_3693581 [Trichonephila clavipes]|nr:hypothetical protein TNCV_3693581 [Trichonephila clavipes]